MKDLLFSYLKLFAAIYLTFSNFKIASASPTCIVGKYTGTGASLTISGIGFQPDVVIVKATTNVAGMYIKTSTMAATASREFATTAGMVTNSIDQLNSDGFRLGTNGDVNTNGTTYYFSAFKASTSVRVGTYTGNGSDPKSVTFGSAAQAGLTISLAEGSDGGYCYSTEDGSAYSFFYYDGSSNGNGNGSPGAPANGFKAYGDGNINARVYNYVSWVNTTGICQIDNYTGNGVNNRNIVLSGTTFQPGFMFITYDGLHLVMRNDKYTTDATQYFTATADAADLIQSFRSDGFQIGTNSAVNTSSTVYTYLAMGGGSVWILPIELLNFSVNCLSDNTGVNIHWTTASESNNDFFTVERSTDGTTFQAIGTMKGADNSSTELDYNFMDTDPTAEGTTNYYRLRQTDYNGESKTFKILSPDCQQQHSSFELSIVQNPVQDGTLFYDLTSDHDGLLQIEIINMLGQTISQDIFYNRRGANLYSLSVNDLNNEIYYLRIHDRVFQQTVKFMKI